jgi:hypothetical protein
MEMNELKTYVILKGLGHYGFTNTMLGSFHCLSYCI